MCAKTVTVVVGPQPPPRHGASSINEAVANLLQAKGATVHVVNTSPASLDQGLLTRLGRWCRVWRAARSLQRLITGNGATAYFSLSGGWALVYETLLVSIARRRGAAVVLHHHSYRYLDATFRPMRWLVWAAGSGALHLVLCDHMGRKLRERYAGVRRTMTLSNAAFLPQMGLPDSALPERLTCIGHLSNLSPEKGLWDVLKVAYAAQHAGHAWQFQIAGPFENTAVAAEFAERAAGLGNVRHVGPVYGAAKEQFLREIDVFLFPTRYRHEAEPLVILEALSCSRPVIAFDRGCIADMLDDSVGMMVPVDQDFAVAAMFRLESWARSGEVFRDLCRSARLSFELRKNDSARKLDEFINIMGGELK